MSSCGDDESVEPDLTTGLSYFPLVKGNWIEYVADSIVHLPDDDNSEIDSLKEYYHFYIREVIDSSFTDSQGNTAFVVLRYRRMSDTLPWELSNVWTANADLNSAQRVEDNIRFIKLKFPIETSTSWNGNAYNFFPEEEFNYENIFEPKQLNSLHFDSTITTEYEFLSVVNRTTKKEIYGAEVGLLYKQHDSIRTANTPSHGFIILNGVEYTQQVTDYKH